MAVAPEEKAKVQAIRQSHHDFATESVTPEQQAAQDAAHAAQQAWLTKMYQECAVVGRMDAFQGGLAMLQRAAPPCTMTAGELALYRMGQRSVEYFIIDSARKAQEGA